MLNMGMGLDMGGMQMDGDGQSTGGMQMDQTIETPQTEAESEAEDEGGGPQ